MGLEVADSEDLSARVAQRGFQGQKKNRMLHGGPNYWGEIACFLNMALGRIYHVGRFAESQLSSVQSKLSLTHSLLLSNLFEHHLTTFLRKPIFQIGCYSTYPPHWQI